jgi:hypothetical protein
MKKLIRSRSDSDFFSERDTFDLIHQNLKRHKFKPANDRDNSRLNKTMKSLNDSNYKYNYFSQNRRKSLRYHNERNPNGTRKNQNRKTSGA